MVEPRPPGAQWPGELSASDARARGMTRRRITALAVAALTTIVAGCDGSERPPMSRLSRPQVDVGRIAMVKFPLYAPPGPVGDVWLREIAETSETGDFLDLNFTAFQVDETRATAAFRPPVDCGPPRPSAAVRRYPCPTSVTTPRAIVAAFDNPRDIRHPYLFMRWRGEHGELRLDEFALPATFAPPRSCGPSSPGDALELPCSLRFTTPEGRRVYTGDAFSPAYVPLGETMVVIDHSFDGESDIGSLVDSLRPKAAGSIRQFSCLDGNSC